MYTYESDSTSLHILKSVIKVWKNPLNFSMQFSNPSPRLADLIHFWKVATTDYFYFTWCCPLVCYFSRSNTSKVTFDFWMHLYACTIHQLGTINYLIDEGKLIWTWISLLDMCRSVNQLSYKILNNYFQAD